MRVTATAGSETAIGCRAVTPSDARSASGHHTTIAMISSVNAAVTSGYQVDAPGTEEENCGQVNTTIADTSAQVETMARSARVMSARYHTPIRAPAGGPPRASADTNALLRGVSREEADGRPGSAALRSVRVGQHRDHA